MSAAQSSHPVQTTNEVAASRRYWALGAVMLVMFTSVMTSTIVSTASPTIVDELHGLDLYAWIFTAYMLASSVTVPVVGKLSDLFGRRPFYMGGLTVFLLGSAICGLSQNMGELIAARALTGIGGGAMMALSATSLGDIFSPRERGRWMGLIMSVFGLGSIVGPTLGGFITDHFGWRWVFYLNLPLGLFSIAMLALTLPRVRRLGRAQVDLLGIGLLIAGVLPILLALTWAGVTYPWLSVEVLGCFAVGALFLIAFAIRENRAAEPVLSLHLFQNRTFTVAVILSFLLGASLFGSVTFLPLYAQGVLGKSAQDAGLILAPLMVGFVIGSVIGGQLLTRTGRYKRMATTGLALGAFGLFLLSRLGVTSDWAEAIRAMVVTGVGVGVVFPILSTVVQSAFPYRLLGTANAARQFFNNLGSVVGVPVMTTILLESFRHELPARLPAAARGSLAGGGSDLGQGLISGQAGSALHNLHGLPPTLVGQVLAAVRSSLAIGTQRAFLLAAGLAAAGLLISVFLPEIALRGSIQDESTSA